jgi:hypothetical protein
MDNVYMDIPQHIATMSDADLSARLRVNLDELLTSGRVYVNDALVRTRGEIDHIINHLNNKIMHAREIQVMADNEKGVSDGLLRELQERYDQLQNDARRLQQARNNDTANYNYERNDLLTRQRRVRDGLQQRINRLTGERDNANAQLANVNAQLVHANNRAQYGIQTMIRLRDRLMRQINALRIQVQWFRIRHNPVPINNPQISWLTLQ